MGFELTRALDVAASTAVGVSIQETVCTHVKEGQVPVTGGQKGHVTVGYYCLHEYENFTLPLTLPHLARPHYSYLEIRS